MFDAAHILIYAMGLALFIFGYRDYKRVCRQMRKRRFHR